MAYRSINADLVVQTLQRLKQRIEGRFAGAGLAKVCGELALMAEDTKSKVALLARPNMPIRLAVVLVLFLGAIAAIIGGHAMSVQTHTSELFTIVSGLESMVNLIVVVGTGVFLLTSFEARYKRHQAMKALHELRSIIHVIDMHQLTKDPSMLGNARTSDSPEHNLTPFELVRYLDYCSEMLSLSGKLAALYAQDFNDGDVVEAASDIEQLATNLSQKVWQKITIVQTVRG
jgi:hypothetical protein